ncbi:MAG TPA: hypothetical protein VGY66_14765, partial [Gemmataceae bacterium]|nr:hypothetical protein [Gemmataceae bacterium]
CAAARAGCGQGKDADRLDDKERARWRKQALDWLRQELTFLDDALDKDDPRASTGIELRLRRFQNDVSLAGVRGQDCLARLPGEERKQWERLWSDVGALLQRVSQDSSSIGVSSNRGDHGHEQ